ncbi:hypothetical protein [Blastomonas sp. CCH5-A3]|jgi:hypothetical protein|uniref:hypothetical protein n=1 Tax=Blastomonas sp. CCH5-A3 TaxID=1768761 RepID=UPI00082605EA|nr:hypothetical protein [Blastomonas sp. CCH5-A3]MAF60226.1 hypothetical protein [Blastomonas sp.]
MSDSLKSTVSLALMAMNQMRCNMMVTKMLADLASGKQIAFADVKDLDAQLGEMTKLAAEILDELKATVNGR